MKKSFYKAVCTALLLLCASTLACDDDQSGSPFERPVVYIMVSCGTVMLWWEAHPGSRYNVERSTDYRSWQTVASNLRFPHRNGGYQELADLPFAEYRLRVNW